MGTPVRISKHIHQEFLSLTGLVNHPHLSRLGTGLVVLGAADLSHHLWGADVDWFLLSVGAVGALWAVVAKNVAAMVAGIVLLAVGFFAVLDDHAAFTRAEDVWVLLILSILVLLTTGLPESWRAAWPLVPVGALVLIALLALLRLAAAWAGAPWSIGAPILVSLLGAALLLLDVHGGRVP
jgi:hypothetical protein